MCDLEQIGPLISMTLTFELKILHVTHHPIMVNNYARLFYNPSMHDEVTARTRSNMPNFDL